MPVLHNLMKRWGFVKLSRYGLALTSQGRVVSLRPGVLDDGTGGLVVGWQDRDLAATELAPWEPARQAEQPARQAEQPVRQAEQPVRQAEQPVVAAAPAVRRVVAAPVPEVPVAAPAEVEEDDWEWTIALARARAAADGAEQAVALAMTPVVPTRRQTRPATPPPPPSEGDGEGEGDADPTTRTEPMATPTFGGRSTQPMAAVAAAAPLARPTPLPMGMPGESGTAWPMTLPVGNIDYDYDDYVVEDAVRDSKVHQVQATQPRVARVMPKAAPIPVPSVPRPSAQVSAPVPRPSAQVSAPVTVIPVPTLPAMTGVQQRMEPVVRASQDPGAARRFAKGTSSLNDAPPAAPPRAAVQPGPRPALQPGLGDDDRTSRGIALPRAAAQVALPSIKRTASRG